MTGMDPAMGSSISHYLLDVIERDDNEETTPLI
jgi:hypothetical protein